MTSSYNRTRLQIILAAPAVSFARQRNYGYVSSQELTAGTHQNDFRLREGL